jgi:hypothetical protein
MTLWHGSDSDFPLESFTGFAFSKSDLDDAIGDVHSSAGGHGALGLGVKGHDGAVVFTGEKDFGSAEEAEDADVIPQKDEEVADAVDDAASVFTELDGGGGEKMDEFIEVKGRKGELAVFFFDFGEEIGVAEGEAFDDSEVFALVFGDVPAEVLK